MIELKLYSKPSAAGIEIIPGVDKLKPSSLSNAIDIIIPVSVRLFPSLENWLWISWMCDIKKAVKVPVYAPIPVKVTEAFPTFGLF